MTESSQQLSSSYNDFKALSFQLIGNNSPNVLNVDGYFMF